MKKLSILFLIVITILAMLALTACGGNAPAAEPTSPPAETVNEEPTAEEPAPDTQPTEEPVSEEQPTENAGPELDENGVPTDIPLMEGFYDLKTESNHTRIIYRVPGTIQDVVAFYQAELPLLGWVKTLGADSDIGAMGSMGRQKEDGDKISLGLSFNPNGNFVTVTIDIHREK